MKRYRSISDLRAKDVGQRLITTLLGIYPLGDYAGIGFRAVLSDDDPRLAQVIHELHKAGLCAEPTGKYKAAILGKEYSDRVVVTYEDIDFVQSSYVSWKPGGLFPQFDEENYSTNNPAIRLLSLEDSLGNVLFASTNFDRLLATSLGRKALEDNVFCGLSFIPAFFVDERNDVEQLREAIAAGHSPDLGVPPLWEVRPTIELPLMLPLRYKHQINGEERVSRNPIDVDRRMAYAKADLDRVGPFDFARPSPSEDSTKALVDPLVVSQRFFKFMKKQKNFDLNQWTPVREE